MITEGEAQRDLSRLVVPQSGSLEATGDLFEQYQLVDADGVVVVPAGAYFRDLAAGGRAAATQRLMGWPCCAGGGSYGRSRSAGIRLPGRRPGFPMLGPAGRQARTAALAVSRRRGAWDDYGDGARDADLVTGKRSPGRWYYGNRGALLVACCALSTTFTWRPAPGRWSTRFRWPGAAGAGRTRITTRCSHAATRIPATALGQIPASMSGDSAGRNSFVR